MRNVGIHETHRIHTHTNTTSFIFNSRKIDRTATSSKNLIPKIFGNILMKIFEFWQIIPVDGEQMMCCILWIMEISRL